MLLLFGGFFHKHQKFCIKLRILCFRALVPVLLFNFAACLPSAGVIITVIIINEAAVGVKNSNRRRRPKITIHRRTIISNREAGNVQFVHFETNPKLFVAKCATFEKEHRRENRD